MAINERSIKDARVVYFVYRDTAGHSGTAAFNRVSAVGTGHVGEANGTDALLAIPSSGFYSLVIL